MERAGFRRLAAIDSNLEAIATLRANFPELGEERARQKDLTKLRPDRLAKIIGTATADLIVGGPPCQGFGTARQRGGVNHGSRRFADFQGAPDILRQISVRGKFLLIAKYWIKVYYHTR